MTALFARCAAAAAAGIIASPALSGSAPPPLNPIEVAAGRAIYQQACASCHGARGEGAPNWQELNAQGEMPAPPHDADGHTWKHADAMLYRMVREGWRDPFNKTQHLSMPAFAQQLSEEQTRQVIIYLKTLWTPEQRQFQWQETLARGAFPPAGNETRSTAVHGAGKAEKPQ
ncbi:MAG: cytochrome c [Alphaproteobacteria bacterium]